MFRDIGERVFVRAVSSPRMSRVTASLADLRVPGPLLRTLIRSYIRAYGVDMSEAAEPLASFPTFNAFFTRRLRTGARPICTDADTVVSPCDSRVHSIGTMPEDGRLEQIKGRTYSLSALLGSEDDARTFARGVHATLYLSPSMYHRVHSPVDGFVRSWRYVPGRLFPVNGLAIRHVDSLFAVNERVSIRIDSAEFGPVSVIMVGAANVGRMSLSFADLVTNSGQPGALTQPPAPISIARGQELGAFNLGSTVVLLVADPDLRPAGLGPGQFVPIGSPLWRRTRP
jgi:phosphatidylserine decarboxylase